MLKCSTISLIFLVFITLGVNESLAQEEEYNELAKIIKSGNAKELVNHFSNSVDLNINGEQSNYGKSQAEAILKDFFNNSEPVSFIVNHKGASKSGRSYAIGEYKNKLGVYRVWIRLVDENGQSRVSEISFIKE